MNVDDLPAVFAAALASEINSWIRQNRPGPTLGPGIANLIVKGAVVACMKTGAPVPQMFRRIDDDGVAIIRRWSKMHAALERGESLDNYVVDDLRQDTHRYLYSPEGRRSRALPLSISDAVTNGQPTHADAALRSMRLIVAELRERFGPDPRAYWRGSAVLLQRLRESPHFVIAGSDGASWRTFCGVPVVEKGSTADVSYAAQGWHPIELV